MAERSFDTNFWTKPFIQKLSARGKLLFAYLKTNVHCNQAGVYTITLNTIAFETGLPLKEIPGLLKSLDPEVVWYPEENIVWVKPFFEEQARSSKFIASALNIITRDRLPEDLPEDFQEYNSRLLSRITTGYPVGLTKRECVAIRDKFTCQYCQKLITLPTDYEMDHVIPKTRGGKDNYMNLVASCRACNQKKMDKTPNEAGFVTPLPKAFHAAQALFLLKNSPELKKGWLQLFPERESIADSMLANIDQHYSILVQDTLLSNANARANAEELGVVKGEEGKQKASNEAKELFDLWNSLGVIKHKKLTGDMTRAITAASRDFSVAEISQAMKNYAHIVNDEQCYFKYRWTLKDFLKRGLEKFLDLGVALSNYSKGGSNFADGKHKPLTKGERGRDIRGPLR